MTKQQKKNILNILVLVVVSALAIWFVLKDNPGDTFKLLGNADIKFVLFAIGAMISVYLVEGVILTILARLYKRDYKYHKGVINCLIGVFFSDITPSNSGGQFAQAYTFAKQNIKVTNAASILFMHFIVYQIILVCFSGLVMLTKFNEMRSYTETFTIFGFTFDIIALSVIGFSINVFIIAGLFILAMSKRVHNIIIKYGISLLYKLHFVKNKEKKILELNTKVETFRIELKRLISNFWVLISCAVLFFVKLCLSSSVPFFVAKSLGATFKSTDEFLNLINTVSMTSFTTTITGMIPLPGASGSEVIFEFMFKNFFDSSDSSMISAIILLWRGITFYLGLILGFIVFLCYHEKPKDSEVFKSDAKKTLFELQVINVDENRKTKTLELGTLGNSKIHIEPKLYTVEDIENHFEEVRKELKAQFEVNEKAVDKENKKKNRITNSRRKKSSEKLNDSKSPSKVDEISNKEKPIVAEEKNVNPQDGQDSEENIKEEK